MREIIGGGDVADVLDQTKHINMNKPKILFVYDLKDDSFWMDGLYAALNILEKDFEIDKANLGLNHISGVSPEYKLDIVLGWGGFNSPVDKFLQQYEGKKGLLIGGNAFQPQSMDNYDVLFYETKWVRDFLNLKYHKNIVHAFGVNTDIYYEMDMPTPILWDYIGAGSFASWKRWEKMIDKPGSKLVIGEYQEGNEEESLGIVKGLVKGNVMVSNALNPFDYSMMLHCSRTMYIPADIYGGGERAILEARASGLQVVVEDDNPKLKELLESPIWDHKYYAEQLKKGIMSVI